MLSPFGFKQTIRQGFGASGYDTAGTFDNSIARNNGGGRNSSSAEFFQGRFIQHQTIFHFTLRADLGIPVGEARVRRRIVGGFQKRFDKTGVDHFSSEVDDLGTGGNFVAGR